MAGQRGERHAVLLRAQPHERAHEIQLRVDVRLVLAAAIRLWPGVGRRVQRGRDQRHHGARVLRGEAVGQPAHHEQVVDGTGLALAGLHDLLVGDHPLAGHVASLRFKLAPGRYLARGRQLTARQLGHALEPLVALALVGGVARRIRQILEVAIEP